MDIANQLEKLSQPLSNVDESLVRLNETVDKLAAIMGVAEERQKAVNNVAKEGAKLTELERKLRIREYKFKKQRLRDEQKSFKDLSKITNLFSKGMSVAVTKLQIFSKNLGNKILSSIGGAAKGALGGIFNKAKGMLPLAAILSVPGLIVRQLLKVSTTMAELAKSTGLVGSNLTMVTNNVEQATAGLYAFGMNMEDVGRQAGALVDALGNASYVTEQLITNVSLIAKATGMSADEAANLTSTLIKGFDKTAPQVKEFADSMMSFATTSGVNARKVMRDIANDSNLTSIYLGRGEDYLMKSAVLAAKMGKSLAEQNATLDAFSTIESSVENVAEINRLTGANLDAQKMFMMFQTQDTLGVMKELQGAFSNPRAVAMIDKYPGAFKQVASSLNLSIKDLRQLDRVMADFEKSTAGASKSQQEIEDHIKAGMDILEQMKGIFFSAILPAFNNIGKMLMENIKPTLNDVTDIASNLGKNISKAMDAEETFGGKLKALFNEILTVMQPAFAKIGAILGTGIYDGLITALKQSFIGRLIVNTAMGAGIGAGVGALAGGVGAAPGAIGGALVGAGGTILDAAMNAKGNVYSRPTLGIIGEENRSEVVIPTERIRKGLPVSASVAAELSSIGVPGFFGGGLGGGMVSSTAINEAANTFTLRQQQNAALASQGDPEAIRRVQANIEKQSAIIKKDQRSLVNDIFEETLSMERERYRREPDAPTQMGDPDAPIKDLTDELAKNNKSFFRRFEGQLHDMLTGLDNFMQVTGTTFEDIYTILPQNFRKQADAAFNSFSEATQQALEKGVSAGYEKFLETGKLADGIQTSLAVGLLDAGQNKDNKGTRMGFLQQIAGRTFEGATGMGKGDLFDGKNLTNALMGTVMAMEGDKDSFIGGAMAKDEADIQKHQNAIFERENAIEIHEANRANLDQAMKDRDALKVTQEEQAAAQREAMAIEVSNMDTTFQAQIDAVKERKGSQELIKELEMERIRKLSEMDVANAAAQQALLEAQAKQMEGATNKVSEMAGKANKSVSGFLKKKALDQKGPLGKLANKATTAFGDFGKSIKGLKGLKSGALSGAMDAFKQGGGIKDIAASAISGGVGKMAGTAITGALAPVLGPLAPFAGQFLGGKIGGLVGGAVGKLFGGKVIKPKKARAKITDTIAGALTGVTRPGMQLSKLFAPGTPKHKVMKANIGIAAAKSPEKLYNKIGDIMYDASGMRFSTDRVAKFTQALYKGDTGVIDSFESEMETGITRAGASGAIVSRPTVALIGEAGPEALMPLENAPGASPLNGVGGDGGELLQEIKRMNQMLGSMANRPITLDGQRVNAVLNASNSDDIRAGIYTVNSR